MATGIIASLAQSTTFVYTSPTNCKLSIQCAGNGVSTFVTLNAVNIFYILGTATGMSSANTTGWVGAGQTITIVTSANCNAVISVYEE